MDLTNRQWRALAQAYPYFFPSDLGTSGGHQTGVNGDCSLRRGDFAQYVVPRASKAFQAELEASVSASARSHAAAPPPAAAVVEAILTHLFGRPALFADAAASKSGPSVPTSTLQASSAATTAAAASTQAPPCAAAPLTPREVQLLGLYHRKQEQYAYVQGAHQRLLTASRVAVNTLQTTLQTSSAEAAAANREGNLLDSTRESLVWLSGASEMNGGSGFNNGANSNLFRPAADCTADVFRGNHIEPIPPLSTPPSTNTTFTSALANLPYAGSPSQDEPDAHKDGAAGGRSTSGARPLSSLIVINRCAGCGEVDGDLLVCTQCGEIRHEACGGPHPPERSRVDGSLPSVNICRKCAKELNVSSSSSSLDSDTSSSERAELDAYFDSEEDSDSSLSGFVVHSSEEDEEDEGDDEENQSSRGSSQSPSKSLPRQRGHRRKSPSEDDEESESEREVQVATHRDRSAGPTPSSSKKARTHTDKAVDRKRTRRERRGGRESSAESSGSEEEGDGRKGDATTPTPPHRHRVKTQRRKLETKKHRASPSTSEDEASASSVSSADAPLVKRKTGKAPPTPAAAAKKEKKKKANEDTTPLSTQEKRRLQDEEDELAMLGIGVKKLAGNTSLKKESTNAAASSTDASPSPSQPQSSQPAQSARGKPGKKGKSGRRSVVNVASSSSSDSD